MYISKWGIDPERDIWSLGVMVQGSGQMEKLSARRRRRRRHLEIQVDIQARELYLEFSLMETRPGEAFLPGFCTEFQ